MKSARKPLRTHNFDDGKGSLTCTFQNVYTVFIRIAAAATINFSLAWVWLLIEGGFCSKAAYIKFGPILDSVIHKNRSTRMLVYEDCTSGNQDTIIKKAFTPQ